MYYLPKRKKCSCGKCASCYMRDYRERKKLGQVGIPNEDRAIVRHGIVLPFYLKHDEVTGHVENVGMEYSFKPTSKRHKTE